MNAFALLSSDPGKDRKDKPRKGKKKQAEETNTSKAPVKDRSWGVEHDDGTFVAVRPRSQSKAKTEAVAQEKQVVGPSPASLEQAAATAKGSARLQLVQDWTTKVGECVGWKGKCGAPVAVRCAGDWTPLRLKVHFV